MQDPQTVPVTKAAQRVIKKYPNRRLYDTAHSSYITLTQVRELVMAHTPFVVRDAKTGEDLTRSILLQIILEEEAGGMPMFTYDVLTQIIRFYGDTLQGMMGNYLEKSLQAFVDQQHLFREQMRTFIGKNPLAMMTELVEHNLSLWKSVSDKLQQYVPPAVGGDPAIFSQQPAQAESPAASSAEREKPDKDRRGKKDPG